MKTRTFRAPNMMTALQQIKQELGPEAIIVSARQVPGGPAWQVWRKPIVEVVAMQGLQAEENEKKALEAPKTTPAKVEPKPAALPETSTLAPKTTTSVKKAVEPPLAVNEAPQTKTEKLSILEVLDKLPVQEPPKKKNEKTPPQKSETQELINVQVPANMPVLLEDSYHQLLEQGVDRKFVNRLIATCLETLNPNSLVDENRVRQFISRQLEACIKSSEEASISSRIVCLVGATGSGKTNTCAKLVARRLSLNKKVVWVSADTVRTGAIAEARVFTDTLNIPLFLAYTPEELSEIAANQPQDYMVIVDTPGCNPRNQPKVIELGSFLTALPNRATYLVASAATKEEDINETIAALGIFGINGLIITKMDETRSYGSIFNVLCRSKLPITYFTTGTRVLEDLRPANIHDFVMALFKEEVRL
jgi:flagellar biosynthesis protein FlhF